MMRLNSPQIRMVVRAFYYAAIIVALVLLNSRGELAMANFVYQGF